TVTGTIGGINLVDAHLWLPYSHGEVHSRDIQVSKGYAATPHSQIQLGSGSVTGCALSNGNKTADCPGQKAVSLADNDAGTTPPDYDKQNVSDGAHTVAVGSGFSLAFGTGSSAISES